MNRVRTEYDRSMQNPYRALNLIAQTAASLPIYKSSNQAPDHKAICRAIQRLENTDFRDVFARIRGQITGRNDLYENEYAGTHGNAPDQMQTPNGGHTYRATNARRRSPTIVSLPAATTALRKEPCEAHAPVKHLDQPKSW